MTSMRNQTLLLLLMAGLSKMLLATMQFSLWRALVQLARWAQQKQL
jgi:hypothetical protein